MNLLHSRRVRIGATVGGALAALILLAVALFPYGLLKGMIEHRLSARYGRPVTIAVVDRVDTIGFSPTLAVRGLTIPQPAWAGRGDFVRLAEGRATVSVWSLLFGQAATRDMRLKGLRLAMVRRADGVTNWNGGDSDRGGSGGIDPRSLVGLTIVDGKIVYRDAKRDRMVAANVALDPGKGLRIDGRGTVRGAPVTLSVRGPATRDADRPWPFIATLDGPELAMTARGTTDRPLALGTMSFAVTARARDLRLVDAVIEAGLFGTQPVSLAAKVRRDRPDWTITGLAGTIGGSDIAGDLTVRQRDGRHLLAGHLVSRRLAFEDLSSDEGRAKAAALVARDGRKLVPNLKIDLTKLAHTDGRLEVRVDHITSRGALAALRGTLTLDHQRLVVDPFTLDLTTGAITGRATVTQGGAPAPMLTLDLMLAHSSIPALGGGGGSVTGTVAGHARLTGRGGTIREAVGASDGSIGFVARDGILPARVAAALGFDAGRAFFAGADAQAGLRCVVLRLAVRRGVGTLDPALIIDTSQSQLTGHGTIRFPSEAMAITVTGAPKQGSILRLPGSATVDGTIREPAVIVAPGVKSIGNVLKAIGRAITGNQPPVATDADCGALSTAALR